MPTAALFPWGVDATQKEPAFVGTHRRPSSPNRARIGVLSAAAATAVAFSAAGAGGASAATKPTPKQVQAEIDALHPQTDAAVEAYDRAQEQRAQVQKRVTVLEDEIARQQAAINTTLDRVGGIAAAQYQDGAIDPSLQLMLSSDPSHFLERATIADQVSASQAGTLQMLASEQATLNREKSEAEAELAQIDNLARQASQAKATVQQKLKQAQALLDSLTARQRQQLAAGDNSASSGAASTAATSNTPASSAAAAAAFAAAKTRLGMPYLWGGTGPDAFDCSGFMQWAYARAGIALPRTTYGQDVIGTVVPLSEARVGDLVFFNNDTHVGMYAGGGTVLHAPHTGAVIRFESISTVGTVVDVRRV